jgi:hypothetical protein
VSTFGTVHTYGVHPVPAPDAITGPGDKDTMYRGPTTTAIHRRR